MNRLHKLSDITVQFPDIPFERLSQAPVFQPELLQEKTREALRAFLHMPANQWMLVSSFEGAFAENWLNNLLTTLDFPDDATTLCSVNQAAKAAKVHLFYIQKTHEDAFQKAFAEKITQSKKNATCDWMELLTFQASDNSLKNYLLELMAGSEGSLPDISTLQYHAQPNKGYNPGVVFAKTLNWENVFGEFKAPFFKPGLVHLANHGVLILPVEELLAQPALWFQIKNICHNGEIKGIKNPNHLIPTPVLEANTLPLTLRILLVANHTTLGEFQHLDPDGFAKRVLYTNLLKHVETQTHFTPYLSWLNALRQQDGIALDFDKSAIAEMLSGLARITESRRELPFETAHLKTLMQLANQYAQREHKNCVSKTHIQQAMALIDAPMHAMMAELDQGLEEKLTYINTQDSAVGQINALTVLHLEGHPYTIGEAVRLTATIHLGDADLIDIERKAELAGHIHAKAMLIIHSFMTHHFSMEHQCPYSAALVFEQSYNEIDGDSASLAGLCALLSALSDTPIEQNIAVTGAIDQFGNVLTVGGVNQKIEGFFRACRIQGITGNQGVIIPAQNQHQLQLSEEVQEAILNEDFHVYTVTHVDEAIELLTDCPAHEPEDSDSEHVESIFSKIHKKLDHAHDHKPTKSWFQRLFNLSSG